VTYVVPRRLGKVPLRLPPAKPGHAQIYFIGATNVPLSSLDPALTRPGRMGRHVWFRTPTKDDRKDIFDLYLAKVDHDPELDTDSRRDEIARITNGYSPAMIEQVCSMALTYAHHDGRDMFEFSDLVEAMTTVESGSAIGVEYTQADARAVAVHEAGHAVAAHVYMEGLESVRLSIRHRGGSLGHHQAMDKEERFGHAWRHEEVAKLIWGVGSMAAERVFFADTSNGVGGDLQTTTTMAAAMVGVWGMGPDAIELNGRFKTDEEREEAVEKVKQRFEKIGVQLMARASLGVATVNPLSAVLGDRDKRSFAAQLLGQAYMAAHLVMEHNRDGVERVANVLLEKKEIFGNELLALLNAQKLEIPYVDLTKDEVWPTL
jgi:ATP-dependent Zn protease